MDVAAALDCLCLHHTRNALIMTVATKVAFLKKMFKTMLERKMLQDITLLGDYNDEIIIKTPFL